MIARTADIDAVRNRCVLSVSGPAASRSVRIFCGGSLGLIGAAMNGSHEREGPADSPPTTGGSANIAQFRASVAELERLQALRELDEATPPMDVLIEWARANRPPQAWFDEPDDLL